MDKRMAETPRHNISFLKKRDLVCLSIRAGAAMVRPDLLQWKASMVPTASMSLLGLIHGWNG
jgi:hypothetical protein